ncbi:hypothetical protein BDN70DRAFT_657148 [Pholiota conissans]|uniref:Uncharacterized protein n=1 Tax=Pholiota conissans TaxID=109636 RepID=A0A9P5YIY7_9AGAR|nr:hypothetical protein BDN70DRAFT_657148 [Pholiota conissans]
MLNHCKRKILRSSIGMKCAMIMRRGEVKRVRLGRDVDWSIIVYNREIRVRVVFRISLRFESISKRWFTLKQSGRTDVLCCAPKICASMLLYSTLRSRARWGCMVHDQLMSCSPRAPASYSFLGFSRLVVVLSATSGAPLWS